MKPNLDLSLSLSLPSKVLRITALRLQQKRCTVSSLVANYYHLVLVLAVAYKYVQDLQYVCITCRFPLFLQVKKLPPQKHNTTNTELHRTLCFTNHDNPPQTNVLNDLSLSPSVSHYPIKFVTTLRWQ